MHPAPETMPKQRRAQTQQSPSPTALCQEEGLAGVELREKKMQSDAGNHMQDPNDLGILRGGPPIKNITSGLPLAQCIRGRIPRYPRRTIMTLHCFKSVVFFPQLIANMVLRLPPPEVATQICKHHVNLYKTQASGEKPCCIGWLLSDVLDAFVHLSKGSL